MFYRIQDMRDIGHYLDLDTTKLLAIALVSRYLYYCNSLLYGITDTDLTKLQRIQNRLAHAATNGLVHWTGYHFVVRQSLCCVFQTPACALKQGTLPHLLHLWTVM